MPFDELKTDERLDKAPKRKDFEAQLMGGCAVVLVVSVLVYAMAAWPFFVFPAHLISGLVSTGLLGCVPATVIGIIAIRRFGVPGASGFVGGGMVASMFFFLRLQQIVAGRIDPHLPQPEYPDHWSWLLPLAWTLWTVTWTLLLLPQQAITGEKSDKTRR